MRKNNNIDSLVIGYSFKGSVHKIDLYKNFSIEQLDNNSLQKVESLDGRPLQGQDFNKLLQMLKYSDYPITDKQLQTLVTMKNDEEQDIINPSGEKIFNSSHY